MVIPKDGMDGVGRRTKKEEIDVYIWMAHTCTAETNITLSSNYTLKKKFHDHTVNEYTVPMIRVHAL